MNSSRNLSFLAGVLSAVFACSAVTADDAKAKDGTKKAVSFYNDVRPILVDSCQGCHQPAKAGGKFDLTTFAALMKGGRSQDDDPIVVPGQPQKSYLITEITPQDGDAPEMPKNLPPLSADKVKVIADWIAQGAKDDTPDSVKIQFTAEKPPVYEHLPVLTSIDYSPDGSLLAVSGYHEALIVKSDGSGIVSRLVGLSERIQSVAFSPDGKRLAVIGGSPARFGEVQIWDVAKGKLRFSVQSTYDTLYGGSWSHDGKLIAFGCADNTVRAIDSTSGKRVLFNGAHNDWVLGTVFSNDSSHLVTVSRDRSMKLMLVKSEQFIDNITSITPGALKGGLMSVDRRAGKDELLVGGADGTPKLFRMHREKARKIGDDYNLIRNFAKMDGRVFTVGFNKDGSRVVAGSSKDGKGQVRLYQTDDAKQLWSVDVPGAIYSANISPDGKTVAAGGFAGKVILIDAANGKITKEFVPVPLSAAIETASAK